MKILHIASFIGNIGDNASHMGFRNILDQIFGKNYKVEEVEIRRFYKNYSKEDKQYFDKNFVRKANNYDLLFIGGGGFLDYWVKGSQTGTTIDISEEVLNEIKTPIVIGSVGSMPHKPIPIGNKEKYHNFLKYVSSRDSIHILLRNDGSKKHLLKEFGSELIEPISEILDNAFFYEPKNIPSTLTDQKYILINTTLDQLQMQGKTRLLDIEDYNIEMLKVIQYILCETNYDIVFAPHIYKDIEAIMQLIESLNDFDIRSRIKIAPYTQGNIGADFIFNLYRNARINIGMRFHSNICSVHFGVPT